MVKAFRQKSFSFKRLHYSIKNYTKTVHSVLSEPGTDDSGLYRRAIWNLSVYYPDGHLDRQLHHRLSVFCGFLHFLFDLCVCGGFHFDEVLYAFVNAMQVGNAVEHMDQVLAEPEIPERSTEL